MNPDRIPAQFYVTVDWLEAYGYLTGTASNDYCEIVDVNHLVPPFSIHKYFLGQCLFQTWTPQREPEPTVV
jgi:hypothetical protein